MIPLAVEDYFDAEACAACGLIVYYPLFSNGVAFCRACGGGNDDDSDAETDVAEWDGFCDE